VHDICLLVQISLGLLQVSEPILAALLVPDEVSFQILVLQHQALLHLLAVIKLLEQVHCLHLATLGLLGVLALVVISSALQLSDLALKSIVIVGECLVVPHSLCQVEGLSLQLGNDLLLVCIDLRVDSCWLWKWALLLFHQGVWT
jgi:hypothetical protein